ncbi:MAG: hypothetical protein ORN56_00155 [Chitinophagales bacterium]|nr:hypothetical protein [Chitinophagales bacterium]
MKNQFLLLTFAVLLLVPTFESCTSSKHSKRGKVYKTGSTCRKKKHRKSVKNFMSTKNM